MRAVAPGTPIGITLNLGGVTPASDSREDLDAARRADDLRPALPRCTGARPLSP